ncbi:MAG: family 20 glycosylhydrolase [Planctomycetota bacterium]|nr:family 20 glycosylhydrolase [Planctomycetota bacterium]
MERAADPLRLLAPSPVRAEGGSGLWRLPAALGVVHPPGAILGPALQRLERALAPRGVALRAAAAGGLHLGLDDSLEREAYELDIDLDGARLHAGSDAGLSHGLSTLAQWVAVSRPEAEDTVAELHLADAPAFPERGAMLDVARGRVPTMEALLEIVERLASWKLNRLQLYMEASFAYAGHESVWEHTSPFTPAELTALDAFCRERHVELVPNQQSLGHMHRWLVHPAYRHLAECPEGVEHPFSREPEPFSLAPADPEVLALLADLYDQLLPCFSSRVLNVGLDETFDIGRGRSAAACAERGPHAPYLDHLAAVAHLAEERGFGVQFWGDVVLEGPGCIDRIPAGCEALVWGYEADHPFEEQLPPFVAAGLPFQVCPGTSSWNSVAGRARNALANLAGASDAGRRHGARGVLITDWGDRGHLQAPWASHLGWLAGAACAWNPELGGRLTLSGLPELLDRHAFDAPRAPLGRIAVDLAEVHAAAGAGARNGTSLFYLLAFADRPLPHELIGPLDRDGLVSCEQGALALAGELSTAAQAPSAAERLLAEEMGWAAELSALGARLGVARLDAPAGAPLSALAGPVRRSLRDELARLVAAQRTLWPRRARRAGLDAAVEHLERVGALLA